MDNKTIQTPEYRTDVSAKNNIENQDNKIECNKDCENMPVPHCMNQVFCDIKRTSI
jgi:hypothetical protein